MAVDWKKLIHAQGSAVQIPKLIKDLSSQKGKDIWEQEHNRYEAYVSLMRSLVDGAQWFSATVPAAELLLDIVKERKPGTEWALKLLADMVCGDHLRWIESQYTKGLEDNLIEKELRQMLCAHSRLIESLIFDADLRIQKAAAFLLACLPDLADWSVLMLQLQINHDQEETVIASGIIAYSIISLFSEQGGIERDFSEFYNHPSVYIRGAAAMGHLIRYNSFSAQGDQHLAELLLLNEDADIMCWGHGDLMQMYCAVNRQHENKILPEELMHLTAQCTNVVQMQ
jgi:hypothetical protein